MSDTGNLSKKSIEEIQEMLTREKSLLQNVRFVQKLPDKGAKLTQKIEKIEKELATRVDTLTQLTDLKKRRSEVENLEWSLRGLSKSSSAKVVTSVMANFHQNDNNVSALDSDDDDQSCIEELPNPELEITDEERIISMLATSQISQNQPKHITIESELLPSVESRPLYVTKLAEVIDHKSRKSRFVLNQPKLVLCTSNTNASVVDKSNDASVPAVSNSNLKENESCISNSSGNDNCVKKKIRHWDESLAPAPNLYKSLQVLSLEESFDLCKERQKTSLYKPKK